MNVGLVQSNDIAEKLLRWC